MLPPTGLILTGGNSLLKYGGNAEERDTCENYLFKYTIKKNLPIIGDSTYNPRKKIAKKSSLDLVKCVREFPRQALHATYIAFCHHKSKDIFEWSEEVPQDMKKLEEAIIRG